MRVSDHYNLGRTQASLDFVDVILDGDTKLFVDPRAFRLIRTPWGEACVDLLQEFFSAVLEAIHYEDEQRARMLLLGLNEPNETHLGLSTGNKARGRGVGRGLAEDMYESLLESEARKSGLLQDLEDTAIMVEGIGSDRVSDIATNIIRPRLIEYTQSAAETYGIPLESIESGPMWNPEEEVWESHFVNQPVVNGDRLLLVPKAVVRYRLEFDPGVYYTRHILSFLRDRELEQGTGLVQVLKDGTKKVYKKDVRKKYERDRTRKEVIVETTRENPEILEKFRASKQNDFSKPLELDALAARIGAPPPNWNQLYQNVTSLTPGGAEAHKFHDAIEALLTALLYPSLIDPVKEQEIDQGIKRIDIHYTNMAVDGFFLWFQKQFAKAPFIAVECKNYKADPKNPEIAQLVSRFSAHRGRLGLLVCRKIENRDRFIERCRAELHNNGNFVIGLDDDDLKVMVDARKSEDELDMLRAIKQRFDEIVL